MQPEVRLQIQEYDFETTDAYVGHVVEGLKPPTRDIARLFITDRGLWHGPANDHTSGPEWEAYKAEFAKRVLETPELAYPYNGIGQDWTILDRYSDPRVQEQLQMIGNSLYGVAQDALRYARNEAEQQFARYLYTCAYALPRGEYDKAMVELLQLTPDAPVVWIGLPIEYGEDPLGRKASFEGRLIVTDPRQTSAANRDIAIFMQTAQDVYRTPPLEAKVVAGQAVIFSGSAGKDGGPISGFNIPNNPGIAEMAGRYFIGIFPGMIRRLNEGDSENEGYQSQLESVLGLSSETIDLIRYVTGHEFSHGYRYKGEEARWGSLRLACRELWANARNLILASRGNFPDRYFESSTIGNFAYCVNDIGSFKDRFLAERGVAQPTIGELLGEKGDNGYRLAAYVWRVAFLRGLIGAGRLNLSGIVDFSNEVDVALDGIAKNGGSEDAEYFFNQLLDDHRAYPVNITL